MWWRGAIGLVAVIVGVIWFGQGIGTIHGSFMTGQSLYAALGALLILAGAAMMAWGYRSGGKVGG